MLKIFIILPPKFSESATGLSLALASESFCVLGLGLKPCVLDSTSGNDLIVTTDVIKNLFVIILISENTRVSKY